MKPVIREDKGVSEIIGAILLFAIASVLLTSFILWYVPSTGTNNDISYQGSTQSAFSSLDSKMLNPSVTPGSGLSQSFPLGISGTPPFTPSQSTNLYYSKNFNATLKYGMDVNYTNIVTKKTVTVAACANATSNNIENNNYVDQQFKFAVNFQETGLPAGFYWTVTIGGTQESGSPVGSHYADTISFSLSRGTYSYTVTTDNTTDLPSPAAGTVKVTNNETTVPVEFANSTNLQRSVVAAAFGPSKDTNSINTANFVPEAQSTTKPDITPVSYWLNNSAFVINNMNYYPLASQQFSVYQTNTPVSYLEFYLEPNTDYNEQVYQGISNIFVEISHSPFSTGTPVAFNFTNISHTSGSSQYTSGSFLKNLSLKNPSGGNSIQLNQNGNEHTYYINFFEAVKESSKSTTSTPINNLPYPYLCFSNQSIGYGYGPNEFIGTISNPTVLSNVGQSYYYEAITNGTLKSATGSSKPHDYTEFRINSEQVYPSSTPYYFLLGYNIPSTSSNTGTLIVHQSGLPASKQKWNFYLRGSDYNEWAINSTLTINNLANAQFNYTVGDFGKYIPNPQSGFVSILPSKTAYINISFFEPVGSLPSYWAISDKGIQNFTMNKPKQINYVSLYLYNFTIPPGNEAGSNATYHVEVNVFNESGADKGQLITSKVIHVNQTGWMQVFLTSSTNGNKPISFKSGSYSIQLSDVNKQGSSSLPGAIGWGFATMGGYDNYLARVTSDSLSGNIGSGHSSVVTQYNSNSPNTCSVTNQSYMYQIGYYNVTVSRQVVPYSINGTFHIVGSINSKGATQFTLSETQVLQNGIVLTAGKGVTYVTVNPLPIRIVGSSKGLSLSSIAYNMSISKGVSTSVSGTGSTIVSMVMEKSTLANYTVGNSYTFNNKLGKVDSISLYRYSYVINSTYAKYWASTLFTELLGSGNYTSFSLYHDFNFNLNGNTERVTMLKNYVNLYSANLASVFYNINSI